MLISLQFGFLTIKLENYVMRPCEAVMRPCNCNDKKIDKFFTVDFWVWL